jgi:fumarate reductase subunit D
MFLYTTIEAIVAVVVGIVVAVCTKRSDGVVYGKLDKAGRITNVVLVPIYVCLAPLYMFLGMISYPDHSGLLGVLGWVVSIINASAALFCGLGLGFSVALRKKGKSKLSFAVQFAGVVGICLTVGMYCLFAGNLLSPLN